MSEETYSARYSPPKRRPTKRISPAVEAETPNVLTRDFEGVSAAYGGALLFVGYEVEGMLEIVVYPRYRFSSDDRVQGQLGTLWMPPGTSWDVVLAQVDALHEVAQENYRLAVTMRATEQRAHSARYEAAYDAITEVFRESWHGFALRLQREGRIVREGISFEGESPGPILVTWRGEVYTLVVFPTGSILLLNGDRRSSFQVVNE